MHIRETRSAGFSRSVAQRYFHQQLQPLGFNSPESLPALTVSASLRRLNPIVFAPTKQSRDLAKMYFLRNIVRIKEKRQ
jgi:hypothetical protein